MKLIRNFFSLLSYLLGLSVAFFLIFYFSFYNSFQDFRNDFDSLKQNARLFLFNTGQIDNLTHDEIRTVYQNNCYRKCHGEAAMITAVLSPAGWFQVVERMRLKENVDISAREAEMIIKYLDEMYPTTKSRFSFEARKMVHEAVWRNDLGQGDIYCDVIYATPEYLYSIGGENLIERYELDKYHVFIVSFSVHEGEVDLFDLDNLSFLANSQTTIKPATHWQLRFQTADKHHFESIVRFDKNNNPPIIGKDTEWFELRLKNIGGSKDRIFRWKLPIVYPESFLEMLNG